MSPDIADRHREELVAAFRAALAEEARLRDLALGSRRPEDARMQDWLRAVDATNEASRRLREQS